MPKILHFACVEIAKKLWIDARKSLYKTSTYYHKNEFNFVGLWVKTIHYVDSFPFYNHVLSTNKICVLNLLNSSYTHNPQPLLLSQRN